MKNAILSLKRMSFKAFLIILQLSIGLSLLNTAVSSYSDKKNQLEVFNNLFNVEDAYLITFIDYDSTVSNEEWASDEYKKFSLDKAKKILKKLEEFENQGVVSTGKMYFASGLRRPFLEYISKNETSIDSGIEILIDEKFYNEHNIPVSEGRGFLAKDFNLSKEDNIPVILGKSYKEKLKIGDTLEGMIYADEKKYEVIGFYEDYSIPAVFIEEKSISRLVFSNALVIVPYNIEHSCYGTVDDIGYHLMSQGLFYNINSKENLNIIKNELDKIIEDTKGYIQYNDLKDDYDNAKGILIEDISSSLSLGISLIIISLIGIVTCVSGEINRRKKEYGVRLSCGATNKNLIKEQLFEILFMVIIAIVINCIITGIKGILYGIEVPWNIVLETNVMFGIVITLLISIIPMLKIKNLNIIDLMKGE